MTTKNIYPKLSLVGAGPGDPELITVKAINALSSADIVLYDALVNAELLKYVPLNVKRIFVGKRDRRHTYTQDQINALIVDLAFSYGHVVRLKGGDPFVFGRGQEELEYAESFNISTEYIPGISSSVAVPGLSGIPVTERGVSESFWVITGTTRKNEISPDIFKASQTNATVVVLMGVNKLKEITDIYRQAGKQDLPVAVIQNGTLPDENIALGTVDTIEESVKREGVGSPAVIVLGEVVKNHPLWEEAVPVEAGAVKSPEKAVNPVNTLLLSTLFYN